MKKIIIFCICLLITINCYAQTVVKLKNGDLVEGELIEQTDEYIKMNTLGVTLTYWKDDIASIKSDEIESESAKSDISQVNNDAAGKNRIIQIFKEIDKATKEHDVKKILSLVTDDVIVFKSKESEDIMVVKGKEEFSQYLDNWISTTDMLSRHTKILNINIEANEAIVEYTINQNHIDIAEASHIRIIDAPIRCLLRKIKGDWKITTFWDYKTGQHISASSL